MKRCRHQGVNSNRPVLNAVRVAASLAAVAIGARWGLAPSPVFANTDIPGGTTLNIAGPTLVDNDLIRIDSDLNNSVATLFFGTNSTAISGTGTISFQAYNNTSAYAQLNSATNVTVTLGSGILARGNGQFNANLINNGTVSADVNSWDLVLQTLSVTNNATMQAIGGGHLDITGILLNQSSSGNIFSGGGSQVQIYGGATISGGKLSGPGTFQVSNATFNNVASSGPVFVIPGNQLNFTGSSFTNTGTVSINNFNNNVPAIASVNSNMVFGGTGVVSLRAYNNTPVFAQLNTTSGATLTIASTQLVEGGGQINANLFNSGTVSADVAGYDLVLQTLSMTNNATMNAINGGHLDITGITLNQSSSGIISAGTGSLVQIYGGATISGGLLNGPGAFQASGATFNNLSNAGSVLVVPGYQLNFTGSSFTNTGTVSINNFNNNVPAIASVNSNMVFGGSGVVSLRAYNNTPVYAQLNTTAGATLTIASTQLVEGGGQINANLFNSGTVSADVAGYDLVLQTLPETNNALMNAVNGGHLDINAIMVTQTPTGTITAGNGSLVQVYNGATIKGGTLRSGSASGTFQFSGTNTALNDVINYAQLNVLSNNVLNFVGSGFTNNGTLTIDSDVSNTPTIAVVNNSMTFSGSGSVNLTAYNNTPVYAQLNTAPGVTLTLAPSMLVHGRGQINALLLNNGTVSADVPGNDLVFQTNSLTNAATVQAVNGGFLDIANIAVNQGTNGLLFAGDSSLIRLQGGATVTGGVLRSGTASGSFQLSGTNTLKSVVNAGQVNLLSSGFLHLAGTGFTNNGSLVIDSDTSNSNTTVLVDNTMTFSGTGTVHLNAYNNTTVYAQLNTSNGATLTLGPSMLVNGNGQINAAIYNNGTISADRGGTWDMVLQSLPVTNNATIQAINNSTLDINGIAVTQTASGTITAGNQSLVQIYNGATINGGSLRSSGTTTAGTFLLTGGSTLNSVVNYAPLNVPGGNTLNFTGTGFTNNGTLVLDSDTNNSNAVALVGNSMTFSGTGSLYLQAYNNTTQYAQLNTFPGATLTLAPSMLVHGRGQINAQLINNGTVTADYAGWSLLLQNGPITNNSTLQALGGVLDLYNNTITQSSLGTITAGAASRVQLDGNATIIGGTIAGVDISTTGGTNTLINVNSSAAINVLGGTTLNLGGPGFTNNGVVTIDYNSNNISAFLNATNSVTISGTGSVLLKAYNNTPVYAQITSPTNGTTLTNGSGHTIHGNGSINVGGLINNGNILADLAGNTLAITTTGFTNTANLTATNSAFLSISGGALISTGTVTVGDGSTLSFAAAPTHVADSVKTLTITSTGLVDIQNHFLSIDNTATPFPKVKQYIDAAYNLSGIAGDYNGRGGITSSVAKTNVDFMGVGYYNGALQNPANPDYVGQVLGPNANSGAGTGIPQSQILVRPTLTGDLNGDGVVNSYDVNLFNTFGLFNQPTNLGYQAGDLNGDGVVNAKDVTIFNSAGNFNNGSFLVAKAASTLAVHSASSATMQPSHSGTMSLLYDKSTGDVKIYYFGFTGFAGKQPMNTTTRTLSLIDIQAAGGTFGLDATKLTSASQFALSDVTVTGNTEIIMTAINGYLPDGTDLGNILPAGLNKSEILNEMTFTFNYTGSRQVSGGIGGLYIEPEPASLSLLGFGALGLMSRRRSICRSRGLKRFRAASVHP